MIRGRSVSAAEVEAARELVGQGEHLGRWGLACALCQRWQWRSASGRWKNRSTLAVLVELERRGQLRLPAGQRRSGPLKARRPMAVVGDEAAPPAQIKELDYYRPLRWEWVESVALLSNTQRKNVEAMALELRGPEAVRSLQRFVSEYQCDEEVLRKRHWQELGASLADPQGVWSVDASEFPKKGQESVGVAPQYCGNLGKTANCQSGVFLAYVSPKGHALVESRLYLPECWFQAEYRERREQCRVPKEVKFQTKPELAGEILQSALQSGHFPARWVTCDTSFGNNEAFLAGLPSDLLYLAEIACIRRVWPHAAPGHPKLEREGSTVEALTTVKGLLKWETVRICEGEKGPIVAGVARIRVYLSAQRTPGSQRWLFLRNDPNQKIKYALSNAPESCPRSEMVGVSQARWPIERCFQEDKGELGLDHYEHRSWTAWHRHMRLTFLAQLFLLRLRLRLKKTPPP